MLFQKTNGNQTFENRRKTVWFDPCYKGREKEEVGGHRRKLEALHS